MEKITIDRLTINSPYEEPKQHWRYAYDPYLDPQMVWAGKVQMIYIDSPYGIKYGSNFQPFVGKREVKTNMGEENHVETFRAGD